MLKFTKMNINGLKTTQRHLAREMGVLILQLKDLEVTKSGQFA